MAKKAVRIVMTLACTECKERNYTSAEEPAQRSEPHGAEQVLSALPDAHAASRDEIAVADSWTAGWQGAVSLASCYQLHRPVAQLAEQRSPKP